MSRPVLKEISIVSANYNNAAFLDDFFQSVEDSSSWPGELVIVDDGSSDESPAIIEKWASKYDWIRPVLLPVNVGVANTTNRGIAEAKGAWILRIDPDDMLMPHRIQSQWDFVQQHPEVDVLGGNCVYVDGKTRQHIRTSGFPSVRADIEKLFHLGENGVLNGTTLVKKSWFERFPYRQEMVWAEDYDCFAHMLHAGAVMAAQREPNTWVRIHRDSATSNLAWDTLEKAWKLSIELFGNKRSLKDVKGNFHHLQHYRRYLLSKNSIAKWWHLAAAVWWRPEKVLKSIFK